MEPLFELETVRTSEMFDALVRISIRTVKRGIFALLGALLLVLSVLLLLLQDVPMALFFLVMGVFFCLWAALLPGIQKKSLERLNNDLTRIHYRFYNTYMEIQQTYCCANLLYAGVTGLIATGDFLFVCVNSSKMHILDLRGCQRGRPEELAAFLSQVCGKSIVRV